LHFFHFNFFYFQEDEVEITYDENQLLLFGTVSEHSRLCNEFEVLQWLGKGGFGDVLKVRNKLDGGVYALKRIKLNPKNKQLNKKITREVKLLSRLNHENVVRYFNSWIETVMDSECPETSETTNSTTNDKDYVPKTEEKSVRFQALNCQNSVCYFAMVYLFLSFYIVIHMIGQISFYSQLGMNDNIEELAPPIRDSDWSESYVNSTVYQHYQESDDEDLFGMSFMQVIFFNCDNH